MSFIKYDKNMAKTFQSSLSKQATKLSDALGNIETFCSNSVKKVNYDTQIYVKHVSYVTHADASGNEWTEEVVSYSPDYRTEWTAFKSCVSDINTACSNVKSGSLSTLSKLADAINSINLLIEEFDKPENFTLVDALAENSNIKVEVDEETQQEKIYFIDENGNEIAMSDLLNAVYTYTGITMDSMIQAGIIAEHEGYELTTGMQNAILNNVNSFVGEIKLAGAYGVVTTEDILAVDAALSGDENYDSILTLNLDRSYTIDDVGGTSSENVSLGKDMMKAYVLGDIPENPEDYKYTKIINSLLEDDISDKEFKDLNIETNITEIDRGIGEVNTEVLTDDDLDYTNPSDPRFDVKPEDFEKLDKVEEITNKLHDNYDDLAREKYESLGEEVISERRQEIILKADELYKMEDKTQLREELSKYGYSSEDIEKIIKDPNATVSAMVEGDQRTQMAEYAKEFAEADGVKEFDTIYDDGQSYADYENGNTSSLLANMSENTVVQEAKENYLEYRTIYKEISDDVSASVNNINDALEKIENIKENNVDNYSEWSQDTIDEYNSVVKQYKEAMEDYNSKLESLKTAETNYEQAYEDYNNAKESFIKQYNPDYESPNGDTTKLVEGSSGPNNYLEQGTIGEGSTKVVACVYAPPTNDVLMKETISAPSCVYAPPTVTDLKISETITAPSCVYAPPTVTDLKISETISAPSCVYAPPTVTDLQISETITAPSCVYAPPSVLDVEFGESGQSAVCVYAPPSVLDVEFGESGQSAVCVYAPPTVLDVEFGESGQSAVCVYAPPSVLDVEFGESGQSAVCVYAPPSTLDVEFSESGQSAVCVYAPPTVEPNISPVKGLFEDIPTVSNSSQPRNEILYELEKDKLISNINNGDTDRINDKVIELGSSLNQIDKVISVPSIPKPKVEIMGDGSIENSSTGGVNVGKIMHGGFNDDVPIISEEPFIDVPTTNTPETLVEIEAKVNDDIEMLDGAELIQPEIKNITSFVNNSIPELIQREVKVDQMSKGYLDQQNNK